MYLKYLFSKKKIYPILSILIGLIGILFIAYQVAIFETIVEENLDLYYPEYTTNNLGGWNFFAYFTILTNTFASFYLIILGLSGFNMKRATKISHNPNIQGMVTIYAFVTGIVYCFILMPFQGFYPWNSEMWFNNIIDIWQHMIIPILITVLWFFPLTNKHLDKNFLIYSLIFPVIYFAFSLIRGFVSEHRWYPYPFLNPKLLWETLFEDMPFNEFQAYLIFIAILIGIFLIFVGTILLLKFFRHRKLKKLEKQEVNNNQNKG